MASVWISLFRRLKSKPLFLQLHFTTTFEIRNVKGEYLKKDSHPDSLVL